MTSLPTVNVASHLAEMARTRPAQPAIIRPVVRRTAIRDDRITFAELDRDSGLIARGLHEIGLTRGVRTGLMVPPSPEFFALTFALFKVGAVPVLIDPGMGIRNLGKCLGQAKPKGFIGIPKAHLARRILGWSRDSIGLTITTGSRWAGGRYTLNHLRALGERLGPLEVADTQADETAAILFTSGSTGIAKGVVYTHGIFATQVEFLKRLYGIEPGEIDCSTFPLFALFGPALGMTAVIPPMDPTRPAKVDPRIILRLVEHYGITNLFGSPALIHRVGRYGQVMGAKLPSLKRVISAGAPVSATVIERFTSLLSNGVQLFTPYGATESLPVANAGSAMILNETRHLTAQGHGVCVGYPAGTSPPLKMDVRVIAIGDQPIATFDESMALPTGTIGEFIVRGPVVTTQYDGLPEATALAKIRDANGRIWHRMGDVGYLDARGRLWFCGRKSHRVVTPSGTLFTIPVEGIFNAHPQVFRTALVGVAGTPVVCVELEKTDRDLERFTGKSIPVVRRPWPEIEQELREQAAKSDITKEIATFFEHPAFPVDIRHNAKIFREQLAVWAKEQLR
jgi:olefin beta-lactone synthetase